MTEMLEPAAAWRMYRMNPDLCQADETAGAVIYAMNNGWIAPGGIENGGPAISTAIC